MKELLTAVRKGRVKEVPALVAGLDRTERRAALEELKSLRKEARGWHWNERDRSRDALFVAGAGCHTGAAACATWLGGRDLVGWRRPPFRRVVEVLADRDPAWIADVVNRLASRPAAVESAFDLINGLMQLAQCPVPTTDAFVRGWAESVSSEPWQTRRTRPLTDILRDDPYLPVLLPRVFELPELPPQMTWIEETSQNPCQWLVALAQLVDEGLVERTALLEMCLARLLRGGKPTEQRFCLAMVRRLEMTEQEETGHLADWIAMAADGLSAVAGHAQAVLGRMDERGELPVRSLAEVSGAVLFRAEKKLVRSQLVLIGKVLRRDPSTAGELLPVVAEVFGHEDIGLQERALKLVTRYLSSAGDAAREELALSAEHLNPVHHAAAAEVFGGLLGDRPTTEAYEEMLPLPPVPLPLAPAPATLVELVEEVALLTRDLRSGFASSGAPLDMSAFERTLDGLVRHAHADRAGLVDALRGALTGHWWIDGEYSPHHKRWLISNAGIEIVVAALLGRETGRDMEVGRPSGKSRWGCVHAALDGIRKARLWEAADAVQDGRLPFLLAVPTARAGSLDPAVLVDRLCTYQRLGVRPGEIDFGQALLRVPRGENRHEAAAAAAALGTPEGDRLAAWLRIAEPLAQAHRFDLPKQTHKTGRLVSTPGVWTHRVLMATEERPLIQREFPRPFHWLGQPHTPTHDLCYHWGDRPEGWTSSLPQDAETLAAWLLPNISIGAVEEIRGTPRPLPSLAELDAPAGQAVHLAVAYCLACRHQEDRLLAVDALLMLAARHQLDAALLGEQLTALLDHGLAKPNRIAESARTAAATGAYRTVLRVLAAVLPGLLARQKAPRGLSDLLTVAAECAEHCGAVRAEPIPGLAETAARGGSSQLVRQAVRLKTAWDQGAGPA
ncbi:DUF6493 family protein [Streptomyces sp. NPDC052042]|uniref:DUF7824 domain-containing protein n=1 Tax=Streptomyces sp. NPDC052042 TaxID=3365683 RepID=UPI0037D934C3